MMHEVVMEWLCTLLVIVWKEEHALSFECIIIIAVNMYLCCIYTHTTVDVQVTFFVLRKSLYLVYQVSSTLYIYIKKYLRRVFIYLLLCFFENWSVILSCEWFKTAFHCIQHVQNDIIYTYMRIILAVYNYLKAKQIHDKQYLWVDSTYVWSVRVRESRA